MPIPSPRPGEHQDKFISRCMGDGVMVKDFPDQKQRAAICYGSWRKKHPEDKQPSGNEAANSENEAVNNEMDYRTRFTTLKTDSSLIRYEKLDGKDYLVAPVIALVEGVHNREFISYDELAMFPESWDGRPLPIDHPKDSSGHDVTANSPDVMESSVVGYFFKAVARDDIRGLSGELWINTEKAQAVPGGKEAVDKILHSQLEVSTAYFTLVDRVEGEFKNKNGEVERYNAIQRSVRPDHLALLPFDIGACSIKDGCGAPRLNKELQECPTDNLDPGNRNMETNVRSSARRPSFSGTETTSWGSVTKSFDAYAKAYLKSKGSSGEVPGGVSSAPSAMKNWIASKTLLGDGSATTVNDLIFFPVVNPNTNRLNKGALRAVLSGRGSQAKISATALNSARNEAKALLKSEFGESVSSNSDEVIQTNGKGMGTVLANAISARISSDGTPTEMIHRLAVAAGIESSKVQAILDGNVDFVPRGWLNIFAAILDMDPWDLIMASQEDNFDARHADPANTDTAANADGVDKTNSADETANSGAGMTISHNTSKNTKDMETQHIKTCIPCEKNLKAALKDVVTNTLKSFGLRRDGETMSIEEKVNALIASDKTQFTENHRDWLMGLAEDQLSVLEPKVEEKTETKTTGTAATTNAATETDKEAQTEVKAAVKTTEVKTEVANKDGKEATGKEAVKEAVNKEAAQPDLKAALAAAGLTEEMIAEIRSNHESKKAARNAKIAEILAVKDCPFEKAEIESFSDNMLDKTLRMLQPETVYHTRAGVTNESDSDRAPEPPAILLAKPGQRGVDFATAAAEARKMEVN